MSKKFEINRTETLAQTDSQRSDKTFSITGERRVDVATEGASESRFGIYGETRPKKCPQCRTQDSVTRGESGRWQCKRCDFQWG